MQSDLKKAREILKREFCTCVLCRNSMVYSSTDRGIVPLMKLVNEHQNLNGFSAADKVVGKAAAFLYCLLRVDQVYATVISRAACKVLENHGVTVTYDVLADRILNRSRDGFCPMETAVADIEDPVQALQAIRETLKNLNH